MNIQQPIDMSRLGGRLWWAMLAGCAARFAAERSLEQAVTGLLFWTLVFAACWMLRLGIQRGAAQAQQVGNFVAMAGMLLFLLRLSTDGIVPALLAFLFAIQAALFVVAAKRLHLWLILSAAFAGVLFAASESRSPLFLVCAGWFTFAALGLLAQDWRGEREQAAALQPVERSDAGAGGFLYGAAALLLALPLYLFVPKPDGLLLGGMQAKTAHDYRDVPGEDSPRDAQSDDAAPAVDALAGDAGSSRPRRVGGTGGDSATPQPGEEQYADSLSISNVERSSGTGNVIVLYVKSAQNTYLRGKLYDRFADDRWIRDPRPAQRRLLRRGFYENTTPAAGSTAVKQSIEVAVNMADSVLVHVPGLQQLRFPGQSVRSYEDGMFEAPRPLLRDTVYSVESHVDFDGGRYLIRDDGSPDPERYLDVPEDVSDRLRELARTVTAGAQDVQGKALALEEHLRTHYAYSYETIRDQGHTPLDWFLFEGRRGHCEFFASALAVMLRTVGVEARVATGFSLGERNPVTGYYEVRALDGHAWVEARIPGKGWLMLEPTPFYPLPQPQTSEPVAGQMERYLDRLAQTSELLDPESLKTSVIVGARETWRQARLALQAIADLPRRLGWYLPAIMLGLAAVAVLAYLAALLIADAVNNNRVRRTLQQAASGDVGTATLLLAQALHVAAQPRGFGRSPGWTFREYVRSLAETEHAVPRAFAEQFDAACYGQSAEPADLDAMAGTVQIIENAVRNDRWPRLTRTVRKWGSLGRRID